MLDTNCKSARAEELEEKLCSRTVGQKRATEQLVRIMESVAAGLSLPGRPLANLLLLGPSGVGKNRLIETLACALHGSQSMLLKIDCAEFQHSHEVAKLTGSPAGYLGHRETPGMLSAAAIARCRTEQCDTSLVVFDEIEKAHTALWQILLGVLDKATLTLGDNTVTDFSKCIIFMTSNLGSREIARLHSGSIGFSPKENSDANQQIYRLAKGAAKAHFSNEFMNRIDKLIVFRDLDDDSLRHIVDIEITDFQTRIAESLVPFILQVRDDAREFILKEGRDRNAGARNIKRCIDRFLRFPLSRLLASGQINTADVVVAFMHNGTVAFEQEGMTALCTNSAVS